MIIGMLVAFWSFLFTFFSRPFEHGTMDLEKWISVSIGYSIIAFISYGMVSLYQYYLYSRLGRWGLPLELSVYLIFYLLFTVFSFGYYSSEIIKGYYGFATYFKEIILNVILILTPLLFFIRRYTVKLIPKKEDFLTLRGENKMDVLKIKKSDLICISNAQNYVEIFFLDNNTLSSKLLRSSLKKNAI